MKKIKVTEVVAEHVKNTIRFSELKNCPHCKCNWNGGDILECLSKHPLYSNYTKEQLLEAAGHYGWTPETPKNFSLVIGIELPYDHPNHYDGISYWQCPECKTVFTRDGIETNKTLEEL